MTEITKMDPSTLEKVVVGGDLSLLNPQQRMSYYAARCEAAGLDPRARPFQYLQLQGKLVLYADKGCADQLCAARALTVQIVDRRAIGDCYEVHVRVARHGGTSVDDIGVVAIGALKGEALCNAIMKAVTKAKRRAILSACGLGMLDESEIETIRDARRVTTAEAEVDFTAPALPPVPSLPAPSALPKGDEMAAISVWLVRIQEAENTAAIDAIKTEMNAVLKRRTKAQTEAIKAALDQWAKRTSRPWSQLIAEAPDSPTLDQIRTDLMTSNLTEDQKRALMGEITHARAALTKVGLGNYDA